MNGTLIQTEVEEMRQLRPRLVKSNDRLGKRNWKRRTYNARTLLRLEEARAILLGLKLKDIGRVREEMKHCNEMAMNREVLPCEITNEIMQVQTREDAKENEVKRLVELANGETIVEVKQPAKLPSKKKKKRGNKLTMKPNRDKKKSKSPAKKGSSTSVSDVETQIPNSKGASDKKLGRVSKSSSSDKLALVDKKQTADNVQADTIKNPHSKPKSGRGSKTNSVDGKDNKELTTEISLPTPAPLKLGMYARDMNKINQYRRAILHRVNQELEKSSNSPQDKVDLDRPSRISFNKKTKVLEFSQLPRRGRLTREEPEIVHKDCQFKSVIKGSRETYTDVVKRSNVSMFCDKFVEFEGDIHPSQEE